MDPNIVQGGQALVAVLGGGVATETLAENYLMYRLPDWAKPLVVPVVSILGAGAASYFGGMTPLAALSAGIGVWAVSVLAHNVAPSADPTAPVTQPVAVTVQAVAAPVVKVP